MVMHTFLFSTLEAEAGRSLSSSCVVRLWFKTTATKPRKILFKALGCCAHCVCSICTWLGILYSNTLLYVSIFNLLSCNSGTQNFKEAHVPIAQELAKTAMCRSLMSLIFRLAFVLLFLCVHCSLFWNSSFLFCYLLEIISKILL